MPKLTCSAVGGIGVKVIFGSQDSLLNASASGAWLISKLRSSLVGSGADKQFGCHVPPLRMCVLPLLFFTPY